MTRGQVGRADLITAIDLSQDDLVRAATLIGYERLPDDEAIDNPARSPKATSVETRNTRRTDRSDDEDNAELAATVARNKPRKWRLVSYERREPPKVSEKRNSARPGLPNPKVVPPVIAPLAPVRSVLVRLRSVWKPQLARGVDVDAAIERISRGEILRKLPRREQRKWGRHLRIIADRSERLVPYWADQDYVVRALLSLFPRDGVRIDVVSEIDQRVITLLDHQVNWADSHLLVLGDLGALEQRRRGVSDRWLAFGQDVRKCACRPLALVPCAATYLSAEMQEVWEVIPWEFAQSVGTEAQRGENSDALQMLQVLLSMAVRLEPGLVREVRRTLPYGNLNAALESFFWQQDELIGTSETAATWHPSAAKRLRQQFDGPFHADADELRKQVLRILETWRLHLPAEIFFEELLGLSGPTIAQLGWEKIYQTALEYFRWLRQNPKLLTPGDTTSDWFHRFEQRLSDATWASSPVADDLAQLWYWAHQEDAEAVPPPSLKTVFFEGTESVPEQRAMICEGSEKPTVQLVSDGQRPGRVIAELSTRNGLLTAAVPFWKAAQPAIANRFQRDEYGAWFEFEVERENRSPVVQRMRWIPPGSCKMGAPESEKERFDDEGPQHLATISQGYWMFDTPCTQPLWSTVMGGNPSRFQGEHRPVERVSWRDAQEFTIRLGDLIGLDLNLPTEAQWEYACRAGTATTFHFGDQITPDRARYSVSGEEETADVGSYDSNAWGLFDMHGNVDEWCHDGKRLYTCEAVVDPVGPTEEGAFRVARGGSWFVHARVVRAAFRYAFPPHGRRGDLGFRCVWVQEAAEPVETVRSDRAGVGAEPARNGGAATIRITSRVQQLDFPDAPNVLVNTDCERLTLESVGKPDWASAFGYDRYGLWADLTVRYVTTSSANEIASFWIFERSRAVSSAATNDVTQRLRWIPPGQMLMGSPNSEEGRFENEGPQHLVTISQGYWMFDTPCSQELWQAVMEENPCRFHGPRHPVESVDWQQATEFSARLSAHIDRLAVDLPTEAQWEYACRARTNSPIYSGDLNVLGDANAVALAPVAWYGGNIGVPCKLNEVNELGYLDDKQYRFEKAGTRQVKGKQPNPWGLFDMLGNVWEWCRDSQRKYASDPETDPSGSLEESADRVIRGGSWLSHDRRVRAACRLAAPPDDRVRGLGFRCICVQSPSGVSASSAVAGRD